MKTCQTVMTDRDTGEQHECGKPATHSAYFDPPIFFCKDCLHDCMQDASPDEQASIRDLP